MVEGSASKTQKLDLAMPTLRIASFLQKLGICLDLILKVLSQEGVNHCGRESAIHIGALRWRKVQRTCELMTALEVLWLCVFIGQ